MRIVKTSRRFRRDYAKLKHSGRRKMGKLNKVMERLVNGEVLDIAHMDHKLTGEWKGFRDCHIEGDWVLIYKLEVDENGKEIITFCATDNHANLFE